MWGSSYVHAFSNFLLPTLFAEGNLPYLVKHANVILHVVTTPRWSQKLKTLISKYSMNVQKVNLKIDCIDDISMNAAHGLSFSIDDADFIVTPMADHILSDGALKFIHQKCSKNIQCIKLFTPRATASSIHQDPSFAASKDGVLSISPPLLASKALASLHETTKLHQINQNYFTTWPSHIYVRPENGSSITLFVKPSITTRL